MKAFIGLFTLAMPSSSIPAFQNKNKYIAKEEPMRIQYERLAPICVFSLTLIRMTKDEKVLAVFKSLLL
jgi:hypothetical protein